MSIATATTLSTCYRTARILAIALCVSALLRGVVSAQDYERHPDIEGAVIYDYDPSTTLGDDVFGTVIANYSDPPDGEYPGPDRCSHGSPVCMEYANGTLVAFYANTSEHNVDGWCPRFA